MKSCMSIGTCLKKSEECNKCKQKVDKNNIYLIDFDKVIISWEFDHIGELKKEKSELKVKENTQIYIIH